MLTHDGIVFTKRHLFGCIARIFLGDIEKTGVGRTKQFDFDSGWLRHDPFLWFEIDCKNGPLSRCSAYRCALLRVSAYKVKSPLRNLPINALLTILAQTSMQDCIKGKRGFVMDYNNDRNLMVRAQLGDLLDALCLTSFNANPVQFLMRLEAIRETAARNRFTAVAEIAAVFEAAMQRVIKSGGADSVIRNFTEILGDAIGCAQLGAHVAHGLLANVAMRLRA
jgi:hypothetical protein